MYFNVWNFFIMCEAFQSSTHTHLILCALLPRYITQIHYPVTLHSQNTQLHKTGIQHCYIRKLHNTDTLHSYTINYNTQLHYTINHTVIESSYTTHTLHINTTYLLHTINYIVGNEFFSPQILNTSWAYAAVIRFANRKCEHNTLTLLSYTTQSHTLHSYTTQ